MQQGGYRDALVVFSDPDAVDGKVDHCQERVGVHAIALASLPHRFVTKAQADAEAAQSLQQVVVVADERYHLVLGLIYLLILHRCMCFYSEAKLAFTTLPCNHHY